MPNDFLGGTIVWDGDSSTIVSRFERERRDGSPSYLPLRPCTLSHGQEISPIDLCTITPSGKQGYVVRASDYATFINISQLVTSSQTLLSYAHACTDSAFRTSRAD